MTATQAECAALASSSPNGLSPLVLATSYGGAVLGYGRVTIAPELIAHPTSNDMGQTNENTKPTIPLPTPYQHRLAWLVVVKNVLTFHGPAQGFTIAKPRPDQYGYLVFVVDARADPMHWCTRRVSPHRAERSPRPSACPSNRSRFRGPWSRDRRTGISGRSTHGPPVRRLSEAGVGRRDARRTRGRSSNAPSARRAAHPSTSPLPLRAASVTSDLPAEIAHDPLGPSVTSDTGTTVLPEIRRASCELLNDARNGNTVQMTVGSVVVLPHLNGADPDVSSAISSDPSVIGGLDGSARDKNGEFRAWKAAAPMSRSRPAAARTRTAKRPRAPGHGPSTSSSRESSSRQCGGRHGGVVRCGVQLERVARERSRKPQRRVSHSVDQGATYLGLSVQLQIDPPVVENGRTDVPAYFLIENHTAHVISYEGCPFGNLTFGLVPADRPRCTADGDLADFVRRRHDVRETGCVRQILRGDVHDPLADYPATHRRLHRRGAVRRRNRSAKVGDDQSESFAVTAYPRHDCAESGSICPRGCSRLCPARHPSVCRHRAPTTASVARGSPVRRLRRFVQEPRATGAGRRRALGQRLRLVHVCSPDGEREIRKSENAAVSAQPAVAVGADPGAHFVGLDGVRVPLEPAFATREVSAIRSRPIRRGSRSTTRRSGIHARGTGRPDRRRS